MGGEGRGDQDPIQTRGTGVGGSGVSSVVEVGVSIVRDLGKTKADFETFPNFGKLSSGETGVGTRCVIGRLHEIKVSADKSRKAVYL